MVELDVRRHGDDLIVFHGGPPSGPTPQMSRSDARHPPLQAVLEHINGRIAVDLELKEPGYERDVVSLALRYVSPDSLLITSFLDEAVCAAHRSAPGIATGLIVGRDPRKHGVVPAISDVFPLRRVAEVDADFLVPSHLLDLTGMQELEPPGVGAAGAADAMDVVLDVWREVEVHDVRDAVHVDAAGGDVGGHEHAHGAGLEILQRRAAADSANGSSAAWPF